MEQRPARNVSPTNPIANFYEAQTVATADIVRAALNGMQQLQKITLQAMRTGAGGQLSIAQSMATMRDGDIGRSVKSVAAPAAEQSARYQREMAQAIADMNNDIMRASYSMMERMRDALGAASLPSLGKGTADFGNPMASYDSAMRQWQTAVQRMMETPSVAMTIASAAPSQPADSKRAPVARKSKRRTKRK